CVVVGAGLKPARSRLACPTSHFTFPLPADPSVHCILLPNICSIFGTRLSPMMPLPQPPLPASLPPASQRPPSVMDSLSPELSPADTSRVFPEISPSGTNEGRAAPEISPNDTCDTYPSATRRYFRAPKNRHLIPADDTSYALPFNETPIVASGLGWYNRPCCHPSSIGRAIAS